ncbi:unnamed protein product [Cuscuta campestris]|uniref:Major facilitator superfamily associated domain-containing protein n=1 Tax=Cuscuta campestris TaxID=132261 RepID=A0A484NGM6_9ASTE|nr:unnamed protein product [Cuscuta campestris]
MAWGGVRNGRSLVHFALRRGLCPLQNHGLGFHHSTNTWLLLLCCSLLLWLVLYSDFPHVASLILYAVTFFIFSDSTTSPGSQDTKVQYRWMAFVSVLIGGFFVIIFHLGIKEPSKRKDGCAKIRNKTPWTYWLKKVSYYQVASVYVLTRVVTNVSQSFLAVYVINDLRMNQSSKSLVPAIIYLCSFTTSVLLQELEWSNKRLKTLFSCGGLLWLLCGAIVMWLPMNMNHFMYALSILIGIANSLMMVTSTGMESALVDKHLDGSAFVYGSMGFVDKVLCGVALYFLESFEDADPVPCDPTHACFSVTRFSLGFIPGIAALLGAIVSFTMKLQTSHLKPLENPLLA